MATGAKVGLSEKNFTQYGVQGSSRLAGPHCSSSLTRQLPGLLDLERSLPAVLRRWSGKPWSLALSNSMLSWGEASGACCKVKLLLASVTVPPSACSAVVASTGGEEGLGLQTALVLSPASSSQGEHDGCARLAICARVMSAAGQISSNAVLPWSLALPTARDLSDTGVRGTASGHCKGPS